MQDDTLNIGRLTLDIETRALKVDGKTVYLTTNEYKIFELLVRRKGTIHSNDVILRHLYGADELPEEKIIDVFISKIRKKLAEATGGRSDLYAVRDEGYVLLDTAEDT